jgi:hypothetical protein
MAARQDQTLVIVNIVCIVFALGFAVLAYVGLKGKSDANQQLANASKSLSDEQTRTRTLQTEMGDLREWMGFKREDNPSDVKTAFDSDMKIYAPGQTTGASYRQALVDLYKQSKTTEASEAAAKEQIKDLTARYRALELQKDAQVAAAEAARAKAQADAAADRNQFAADRAKTDQDRQQLLATLQQQDTGYKAQIADRDTQIKQLQAEALKMTQSISGLMARLKPPTGSYEIADGHVSWVNQGGIVWIDLGSADALRPLVTFSVYDADVRDTTRATPKGTLEVTMLMGEHQAEARVTSDDVRNPILQGDGIYSPAWHRGKQQHFALTGIIDIDGDGMSDLQMVRNLISLNDGIVDAYLGDDGAVEGTMSVNTRYLVVGKIPEGAFRMKQMEGWQAMTKDAATLGVETLTLDQFLDQMGYRPDARAVRLGAGASARDFPVRPAEESMSGTSVVPPAFRPRVAPPAATTVPH